MSHHFFRLKSPVRLPTGEHGWVWLETETDDFGGVILLMRFRLFLSVPDSRGFSRLSLLY